MICTNIYFTIKKKIKVSTNSNSVEIVCKTTICILHRRERPELHVISTVHKLVNNPSFFNLKEKNLTTHQWSIEIARSNPTRPAT